MVNRAELHAYMSYCLACVEYLVNSIIDDDVEILGIPMYAAAPTGTSGWNHVEYVAAGLAVLDPQRIGIACLCTREGFLLLPNPVSFEIGPTSGYAMWLRYAAAGARERSGPNQGGRICGCIVQ